MRHCSALCCTFHVSSQLFEAVKVYLFIFIAINLASSWSMEPRIGMFPSLPIRNIDIFKFFWPSCFLQINVFVALPGRKNTFFFPKWLHACPPTVKLIYQHYRTIFWIFFCKYDNWYLFLSFKRKKLFKIFLFGTTLKSAQ